MNSFEPYEKVNGIITKYRDKKTGRIISNIEFEIEKIKMLFLNGDKNVKKR
ncbi:MAG: hypothetical protein QXJ14_02025 [Candidatus Aenigmatarchaeota archaeon]